MKIIKFAKEGRLTEEFFTFSCSFFAFSSFTQLRGLNSLFQLFVTLMPVETSVNEMRVAKRVAV